MSFLTIIRINSDFDAKGSVKFFSVVGGLIGLGLYGLGYISVPFRGFLMVFYLAVITGGLHLDGLADASDAFFSHRDKDEMLRIMKDSRIGTFGVLALFFVLLGKYLSFNAIKNPLFLVFIPIYGRFIAVYLMKKLPYARASGTAKDFFKRFDLWDFLAGFVFIALSFFLFNPAVVGLITACFFLWGFFLFSYFKRKIGGITGDMIGFAIETTELFMLLLGVFYGL
ncbi:Cobalamin synthase [Hippea maritima DSM 10411]|uniref:Adenosylcobinamide-GDP ribazoletransferase n=1 Tax=Hippea maritima (strain ATCC 700847 / DSM 10411 / MH2) TaxID=760142 RepID=F2LWS4_HIPMA|nr:Cobalamin synthase [Hippea maritima DSM 10411]